MKKMVCDQRKISAFFIVIFSLSISIARSQQYRLVAFGGYSLPETFTGSSPEDKLNGSGHFGGIMEFRINKRYSLELMYQKQITSVDVDNKPVVSKLAVNCY